MSNQGAADLDGQPGPPRIEVRIDPENGVPVGVSVDHPVLIWTPHPQHDDQWVLHYVDSSGVPQTYVTFGNVFEAWEDASAWYAMQ